MNRNTKLHHLCMGGGNLTKTEEILRDEGNPDLGLAAKEWPSGFALRITIP